MGCQDNVLHLGRKNSICLIYYKTTECRVCVSTTALLVPRLGRSVAII